ncbi:MinD-like ATPase involved in chromosome partitioning or flagellar assembly [Nocardia amikacinitolerans]|nr:MinD-like ATPase involved in chromosome partitioning or flagellar assembly [Nocardia amikacinitolerans]
MTNNDHNPTSPPWLQSHSVDTAAVTAEPAGSHVAQDETNETPAEAPEKDAVAAAEAPEGQEAAPGGREPAQADAAPETGQFTGYPPAVGPGDPTGVYPQPVAPPGYGPAEFAPNGAAEPYGPYSTGPFAQQPGLYQGGPYQPGPEQLPPPPGPDQRGAPYGEYRQEIGPDGLVRRVPQENGPEAGAAQDQSSGPIYSWAPPPPPVQPMAPPQPMYQEPPAPIGQPPLGPTGPGQTPLGPTGPGQTPPGLTGPGQTPPGLTGPGQTPPGHTGPGQQWGGPQQQPFQPQHVPQPGQPGHSVNDLNLLKRARRAPRSGWRRAVHKASGGMINPGESAADIVYRDLVDRVNQPVRGDYRIAILSLKGGVGKTTTTVGLGSTFASLRGDRVIAIDANPDLGTLAHRVPRQTRSTVRNLLEDQQISRYSDVRAHTSQAPSRLEVLASEQDPAVSEAFSEADYRKAISILQSFYNIILTDCGTGLMHSAMSGVLDMASSLVLVTSPAIDGARSASATLDWLDHHGYGKLVERTVVVVNASRRGASTVDLDQLRKLFLDRTRAVQVVPFDDHLAEGAEIDLELVSKPTRRALLELAAMVADDFGYIGAQQYQHPGPMGLR